MRAPTASSGPAASRTAAVIAEPIQGEGGIRPLSSQFAQAISEVCERTGTLLIADEVQTGLGRTGAPFRFQRPYGSYVMENVLFKISFPAEFHSQTAVEAAMSLHKALAARGGF